MCKYILNRIPRKTIIPKAERNWVFATNSVFVKPISLQPDDVNLWHFKLTLFDLIAFIVWNIKGLRHWVATILKLEHQSLWQKLNSFLKKVKNKFDLSILNGHHLKVFTSGHLNRRVLFNINRYFKPIHNFFPVHI